MKNTINYYYNLNPEKINQLFSYYYFYIHSELYYFVIYQKNPKDIRAIYEFNQKLLQKNCLVHEIINNRNDTILTFINQVPYILFKINININKPIFLSEISYLSNIKASYSSELMRSNWAHLWEVKVDYLEYHHEQNEKKYPLLANSFNYFIGLTENAISYLNDTITGLSPDREDIGVISHDRLMMEDTIYALYNPLNIIIDHKARDLAEYIKLAFFKDNYAIFEELDEYFRYNYFSYYGMHLLVARILYPSFYFDIYDEILENTRNEADILRITSRINDYEVYLNEVFHYLGKYYQIKEVTWLKKRGTGISPHLQL